MFEQPKICPGLIFFPPHFPQSGLYKTHCIITVGIYSSYPNKIYSDVKKKRVYCGIQQFLHLFAMPSNGNSKLFGACFSLSCRQHYLCALSCTATITSSSENDGSSLEWSREGSVRITGHHVLAPPTMRTETCSPVAEEEVPTSSTEASGAIRNAATAAAGAVASGFNAEGPVHYPTQNSSSLMLPRPNSVAGTVWSFCFYFLFTFSLLIMLVFVQYRISDINEVVLLVQFVCCFFHHINFWVCRFCDRTWGFCKKYTEHIQS